MKGSFFYKGMGGLSILIACIISCTSNLSPNNSVVTTPSIPTGISAIGEIANLHITWHPVLTATSYTVYDTKDNTMPSKTNFFKTYTTTDTSLNLSTTSFGIHYIFAVSASNDAGESNLSTSATAATLIPSITSINSVNGSIKLKWDQIPGALSYNIYDTKDSSTPTTSNYFKTYSTEKDSFKLIDISIGTTYKFVISAIDSDNTEGGLSETASVISQ